MSYFGRRIRSLREEQQKSMRELAMLLNTSVVYISDLERGVRHPSDHHTVQVIADFYHVHVTELMDLIAQDTGYVTLDLHNRSEAVMQLGLELSKHSDTLSETAAEEILAVLNGQRN